MDHLSFVLSFSLLEYFKLLLKTLDLEFSLHQNENIFQFFSTLFYKCEEMWILFIYVPNLIFLHLFLGATLAMKQKPI